MSGSGWKQSSGLGVLLVAIGAAFWGIDGALREPLTDDMSSTAIVLAEHVFLAIYAIPVLWFSRDFLRNLNRREWAALLIIAWGGSALATVLFTEGFAHGSPTTVILLQKTQPLVVILLASTLLQERLPGLYWPLFVTAMVGAYLVAFGSANPFSDLGSDQVTAAALALGAAALWGASTVMGRILLGKGSFATVTAGRFFFALPFLFVLPLRNGAHAWRTELTTFQHGMVDHYGQLFLVALLPGLLGMLVYYQGLSRTRASYATLAELSFPATAFIAGWLFLDDRITGAQIVGFCVLWVSIAALSWLPALIRRMQKPASPPPAQAVEW